MINQVFVCVANVVQVTAYAHSSDGSMPALFVEPVMENVAVANGNDNIMYEVGAAEVQEEVEEEADGDGGQGTMEEKQSYRRRSRKGTPRRAPFF